MKQEDAPAPVLMKTEPAQTLRYFEGTNQEMVERALAEYKKQRKEKEQRFERMRKEFGL